MKTKPNPNARVYAYCRKSRPRRDKNGKEIMDKDELSLVGQQRKAQDYIKYRGEELPPFGGFVQDIQSGGVPILKRKCGSSLANLQCGDHLVIPRLDRAFRNIRDLVVTVDQWTKKGVVLHILDLNVDTSTPAGELFLNIMGVIAHFVRRRFGEQMSEVLRTLKAQGRKTGCKPPWGFRWDRVNGRKVVVPAPAERFAIKTFLKWRLAKRKAITHLEMPRLMNEKMKFCAACNIGTVAMVDACQKCGGKLERCLRTSGKRWDYCSMTHAINAEKKYQAEGEPPHWVNGRLQTTESF